MEDYSDTLRTSEHMAGNLDARSEDPFVNAPPQTQDQQEQRQHQHQQQQQQAAPLQQPHIHRPIPRRNFSSNSYSNILDPPDPFPPATPPPTLQNTNNRSSDFLAQLNARLLRTNDARNGNLYEDGAESGGPPTRNKSMLNMTSSTLYGIYDEAGVGTSTAGDASIADTPWGVGAETPGLNHSAGAEHGGINGYEDGGITMRWAKGGKTDVRRLPPRSRLEVRPQRRGFWRSASISGKLLSLFLFGAVYGIIVSHLHDTRELAAVQVRGMDHKSWMYLAGWGLAGLVLGSLLPYVDLLSGGDQADGRVPQQPGKEADSSLWEQCNEVVRSVGAFVGIAFAIRRLPWQSTLQLTLTLALVNPALWYILDRTKNGLSFSLISTSIITSFIFLSNPDVLPSPALPATINATHLPSSSARASDAHAYTQGAGGGDLFAGMISYDSLATATWVGSVIFCSCICFGGIGRRLAVLDEWGWRG